MTAVYVHGYADYKDEDNQARVDLTKKRIGEPASTLDYAKLK